MLSRPADARVRARFRVGAKRGVFRGENGGGAGVFCTMAFGGKGGKAGGKTRKIRPSGGHLCSFRYVAGRSVQDCGKVVQKLAGREDEKYKLCTTLCAPLCLGTRIVQVSFPRCVRCVGVVVRRCAIRSFSLPPAEAGCPFRRRGRGSRQTGAGCCARGRPPLPSPSPTLRTAARDTVAQRRGLFSGAARTLPGSGRRANDILYIRVRRREGENVLHRAASNDVDNFSVDNPLWINAAAGGRLLRGGRGRRCGGSVNADGGSVNAGAEVQTRTGRVRKPSRAMGARRGRLSAPWLRFHGVDRADVYIIIHVRACCCGECALNPPTSPPIPRRRPSLAPAQRHALPEHFRSPTQSRRMPAGCAMHSPPTSQPTPRRRPPLAPAQRHALPEHFRSSTQRRRTPAGCAMHSPPTAQPIPRRPHHPFPPKTFAHPRTATRPSRALPIAHATPTHARRLRDAFPTDLTTHSPAEALRSSPHSDTPFPSTSAPPRNPDTRPRSPDARPQAAQRIPRSPHNSLPAAPRCLPFRSASGTKKRHRTVHVRCRMFRSTVVAVGHLGW